MNRYQKPQLEIQPTTLWDYPSQQHSDVPQGDPAFVGATPTHIIWNLLQRYTSEKNLVVDPFCGSGTTLDVARSLKRRALGYDVSPTRKDIFRADARKLPLEDGKAHFVFADPPYADHLRYSGQKDCLGELPPGDDYYNAMEQAFSEFFRILRSGGFAAVYVSDSWSQGRGFSPIGFELFARLRKFFTPVDIIAVVRHNRTLEQGNYRKAAIDGNFFLRGFNYLFIVVKE